MKTVSLTIDGRKISAPRGEKLLWAALNSGIYIPNLCALRDNPEPAAGCRLCFVEVAGKDEPVTACTEVVAEGMVVNTRGTAALRLAHTAFALLMSSCAADCAHCAKNRRCELQKIARHLGMKLKSKRFRELRRELPVDRSSPVFTYDPNKCVLCGRCVWVCREQLGIGAIGFAYRGFRRVVTTFGGESIADSSCRGCGDCVSVCPTGALVFKDDKEPKKQKMEDGLSAASVTANLKTRFIGRRVLYYPRLTSTMEAAKKEAGGGAAEGTVIIAGEQTRGKGRIKRTWLSPPGNISLSIILHPDISHLPSLIMLASLAVARSLRKVTGLEAQIKWPNDVLINGRKVCGILIESDVRGKRVDYSTIGIGINVNFMPSYFPEVSASATSLADELGRSVSRLDILRQLLVETEKLYLALRVGESIFEEWRDNLVTLGKRVYVKSGETTIEGTAESVAPDGSLLLRRPDGSLARIVAGDVTLRDRT